MSGRLLGSATPIGGDRVLTNRHVIEPALRRSAALSVVVGGASIPARVLAISDRMDLAVLIAARPHGRHFAACQEMPGPGRVVGTRAPGGAALAGMTVQFPWRDAWGPALFVRMPVVFGASGGAVRTADDCVVGLVTAAVNPDARQMLMLRSGSRDTSSPAGITAPVVLVLPITPVLAEAARLEAACCAAAVAGTGARHD